MQPAEKGVRQSDPSNLFHQTKPAETVRRNKSPARDFLESQRLRRLTTGLSGGKGMPKLNRRTFVTGAAAVGVVQAINPKRASAQSGGDFRMIVSQGASSDSLNPATATSAQQITIGWALRNNLTEIGPDDQLRPELAESWSSDDAKAWVFNLRRGVTFSNGKPLTPQDVVESINLHRGEDSVSGAKSLLELVESVSVDGNSAVRVILSSPNADFPLSDYHFQICPVGPDGTLDVSGTGTGAYALVEFSPGVTTKLKRNQNYWKPDSAYFETVEILLVTDPGTATTALVAGNVHAHPRS